MITIRRMCAVTLNLIGGLSAGCANELLGWPLPVAIRISTGGEV